MAVGDFQCLVRAFPSAARPSHDLLCAAVRAFAPGRSEEDTLALCDMVDVARVSEEGRDAVCGDGNMPLSFVVRVLQQQKQVRVVSLSLSLSPSPPSLRAL